MNEEIAKLVLENIKKGERNFYPEGYSEKEVTTTVEKLLSMGLIDLRNTRQAVSGQIFARSSFVTVKGEKYLEK